MVAKVKKYKKIRLKSDVIFQAIFLGVTLFLIIILIVSNFKISKKRAALMKRIESLKEEIQELEQEKQKLEAGISQTGKESHWEEKMREQGYIKEGENPVVVIPPAETQKEEIPKEQNFSQKLLDKIKDLFARVIQW